MCKGARCLGKLSYMAVKGRKHCPRVALFAKDLGLRVPGRRYGAACRVQLVPGIPGQYRPGVQVGEAPAAGKQVRPAQGLPLRVLFTITV